jgi:hypothetical protein
MVGFVIVDGGVDYFLHREQFLGFDRRWNPFGYEVNRRGAGDPIRKGNFIAHLLALGGGGSPSKPRKGSADADGQPALIGTRKINQTGLSLSQAAQFVPQLGLRVNWYLRILLVFIHGIQAIN